jgi:hypothetical protein
MGKLRQMLNRLEKLPQKVVTKSAKKGATIALKSAKAKAPVDVGMLKRGLVLRGERNKKGKKVYQVTFNKNFNDVFQKKSKKGKISYYPASQEYGWTMQDGKYIPGYNYLKDSLTENKTKIQETIIEQMSKEIDKL